ncbi:hypothetical protein PCE1_002841 [Barthelona sp. PCE]
MKVRLTTQRGRYTIACEPTTTWAEFRSLCAEKAHCEPKSMVYRRRALNSLSGTTSLARVGLSHGDEIRATILSRDHRISTDFEARCKALESGRPSAGENARHWCPHRSMWGKCTVCFDEEDALIPRIAHEDKADPEYRVKGISLEKKLIPFTGQYVTEMAFSVDFTALLLGYFAPNSSAIVEAVLELKDGFDFEDISNLEVPLIVAKKLGWKPIGLLCSKNVDEKMAVKPDHLLKFMKFFEKRDKRCFIAEIFPSEDNLAHCVIDAYTITKQCREVFASGYFKSLEEQKGHETCQMIKAVYVERELKDVCPSAFFVSPLKIGRHESEFHCEFPPYYRYEDTPSPYFLSAVLSNDYGFPEKFSDFHLLHWIGEVLGIETSQLCIESINTSSMAGCRHIPGLLRDLVQ